MGETKVVNKYYPPDFDPAKIPRRRQSENRQMKVRMMLPMSIRCGKCGSYIYEGTKFNSRKEDVIGETYLGIQIFRFYFKCTKCSAEISLKTDQKNSDYVIEFGATRNFEPWCGEDKEIWREKRRRGSQGMGDAMKSLENRTSESKREMDILTALDEMISMNSRLATVGIDAMPETQKERNQEEEAFIRSVFKKQIEAAVAQRIDYEDIDDDNDDDHNENLDIFPLDNKETSSRPLKREKVPKEHPLKSIGFLAKEGVIGSLNNRGNVGVGGAGDDDKFIFKSSLVQVSVTKKSVASSNGNKPEKEKTENLSC